MEGRGKRMQARARKKKKGQEKNRKNSSGGIRVPDLSYQGITGSHSVKVRRKTIGRTKEERGCKQGHEQKGRKDRRETEKKVSLTSSLVISYVPPVRHGASTIM
jgi:hypothetical protein